MNVEFSISANTSLQATVSSAPLVHSSNSSANTTIESDTRIRNTRNTDELASLERQGVQVTKGEEHLIRTVERAVKALQGPATALDISIHEKTHQIMVKVMNKETGEVIREVPPEKTLDLVASMMEIAGILIDERV